MFTAGDAELADLVHRLRTRERAQVVVAASELELANNVPCVIAPCLRLSVEFGY